MENLNKIIQGQFPGGMPHRSVIIKFNNTLKTTNDVLQRKAASNKTPTVIQKSSSSNAFQVDSGRLSLNGGGNHIPSNVRQKMESIFNADFSSVRIHTGGYQAESIGALAFTTGNDIYFAQGQYNTRSSHGQRLLGHELTHVVQQRNGRVKNPFERGIAVVNDHSLEAEAERMGNNVLIQSRLNENQTKSVHNFNSTFDSKSQLAPQLQPFDMWLKQKYLEWQGPHDPAAAKGRVYKYQEGAHNTWHARDDAGNHWWWNEYNGSWTKIPHPVHSDHGRGTLHKNRVRDIQHGLMNAITQEGSWAWYNEYLSAFITGASNSITQMKRTYKNKSADVDYAYYPGRSYSANMALAAQNETGIAGINATQYARHFGGHSHIAYNWCHLVSFGLAGNDSVDNIVAATTHNNTEQMAIENALYDYKGKGFSVTVKAICALGTKHLGESIYYQIWYGNFLCYSRSMDCRRATEPTYGEIAEIKKEVWRACHKALSRSTIRRYAQGWTLDFLDVF